jgi:hypothetical protein
LKKYIVILIGICTLVLIFYYSQGKHYDTHLSKEDTITYTLNENPTTERLQKYIENVGNKKKDKINIIRYTIEGDPITTEFNFNGKNIIIAMDISKDRFGGQDKDNIIYTTINGGTQLKDNLLKYLGDNGILKP